MQNKYIPSEDKHQQSILDDLWLKYSETRPVNKEVDLQETRLRPVFQELSLESSDILSGLLVDLCTAYQHAAFLEGIRIGFHLQDELK